MARMSPREPRILRYTRWLAEHRGLRFDPTTTEGYDALWRWSVGDLAGFWSSIWEYLDIRSPTPWTAVIDVERMPGARWFEGATLNYAAQVMRHADAAHAAGHPAIVFRHERMDERRQLALLSWPELRAQVASLAAELDRMGIVPGDRVCAILPNVPQTVVAFLAVASLGAVWSMCSPDMGPLAILDRFRQIEPKALIVADGYVYGGTTHDRRSLAAKVVAELPTVRDVVWVANLDDGPVPDSGRTNHRFEDLVTGRAGLLAPRPLPFSHPLWIVYSSGTTGLPKAIVHGHGGIVLEAMKGGELHNDIGPSVETGDRFHWYSSTGWIMWNGQVSGLLGGTTICIYDGHPSGVGGGADGAALWRFAADAGVSFFGAGAAFYAGCLKAGVEPMKLADLSRLRTIGSTGSPLSVDAYRWIWEHMPKVDGQRIWINPISGGTDFAGAVVGGLRTLPVVEGEMQVRELGAAVEAWNERGEPRVDEVGELVVTKPMPSMPLYFWGDEGNKRYLDSYFDMYPGIWRHGDWIRITPRGGAIIYGRSDATINRHGIRMGTAELYRAVEALPEVLDSLVVDLEYLGRESYMPLFVVLREGLVLDDALAARIKSSIKAALSARHVPNEIFQVSSIPRTLSGKKMELPVKKLLLGTPADQVFKLDAMANADAVEWFKAFAASRAQASRG